MRSSAASASFNSPPPPSTASTIEATRSRRPGCDRKAATRASSLNSNPAIRNLPPNQCKPNLLCIDLNRTRRRRVGESPQLADPSALARRRAFLRRATGEGRRPRPGEADWGKLVAFAYAGAALVALDLTQDLSRRAARLADTAPKLRVKGKARALDALLADDAVSAAAPIAGLSDRARRRLFERLVALGGARELTGRVAFRLYGLSSDGAKVQPRARLRPRARRPAAGIALARMEGPGRSGAVRRGEAGRARHPGARRRPRLRPRAPARRPERRPAQAADRARQGRRELCASHPPRLRPGDSRRLRHPGRRRPSDLRRRGGRSRRKTAALAGWCETGKTRRRKGVTGLWVQ